ncbi:MAG: hypothetical protein EOO25_16755, partial [Comamonadaceae bacterium]
MKPAAPVHGGLGRLAPARRGRPAAPGARPAAPGAASGLKGWAWAGGLIGGARVDLADSRTQWPAQVLAGLGTPWNTLQPEGRLDISSRALSAEWNAGRMTLAGDAVLEARDVSSRLSTLRPMGSYRLRLQGGSAVGLTLD